MIPELDCTELSLEPVVLRRPEFKDVDLLYVYRNNLEVTRFLGGFSLGYSRQDLHDWIERHRSQTGDIIWVIADKASDRCLGHAGLYDVDHRVRSANFGMLIGDETYRDRGLGQVVTQAVVDYGFDELNLHRIDLHVLATNPRAIHIYTKVGFKCEGILRDAQFRSGQYVDMVVMAMLEHERERGSGFQWPEATASFPDFVQNAFDNSKVAG